VELAYLVVFHITGRDIISELISALIFSDGRTRRKRRRRMAGQIGMT